jgi:integral membrane protein (TIGR01906 family)
MTAATSRVRTTTADDRPGALAVALFVAGIMVAGLVTLALLWSGSGPYEDLARANRVTSVEMLSHGPGGDAPTTVTLPRLVELHQEWQGYVTGGRADPPRTFGRDLWTDDEYRHMADVRRVFETAKLMIPVGLLVMLVRLQRARAKGSRAMWRLVRDGSLVAAILVAVIGIVAVVAFEPLFLGFHYLFFPQGNFLFDPATSNLVRLYPDWYWEGISLRVGVSFIAVALGLAALAHLRLRAAK